MFAPLAFFILVLLSFHCASSVALWKVSRGWMPDHPLGADPSEQWVKPAITSGVTGLLVALSFVPIAVSMIQDSNWYNSAQEIETGIAISFATLPLSAIAVFRRSLRKKANLMAMIGGANALVALFGVLGSLFLLFMYSQASD